MKIYVADEFNALDQAIRTCRRCPGLNEPALTQAAPGYGDRNAPVVVIGQSLCAPCMATQVPFTGGSGRFLDRALASASLPKSAIFTTNVVHCHTPNNRPSLDHEIANCASYLRQELALVKPRLIIGLGKDAREWLTSWAPPPLNMWSDQLPTTVTAYPVLLLVAHPSFMLRQPKTAQDMFVDRLATALKWAFAIG